MPSQGYAVENVFVTQSGKVSAGELDQNFNQAQSATNVLANYGNYYVDSGSANSIVVTAPSPLVAAYTAGLPLQVNVAAANTGAVTLALNGLGSIPVIYPSGVAALLPNQLKAGAVIQVQFDGTNFQYLGPIFGSGGLSCAFTGVGVSPAVSVAWSVVGDHVILMAISTVAASNGAGFTMTGLSSFLSPTRAVLLSIPDSTLIDNGVILGGVTNSGASAFIAANASAVTFIKNGSSVWSSTGNKGFVANEWIVMSYSRA